MALMINGEASFRRLPILVAAVARSPYPYYWA
jgi:hypothetical protein